jgi:hypothetical protein
MPKRESILQKPIISKNAPTPAPTAAYWRVNDFDQLISSQGYDALIDRAMRCPCCDKTTGQALSTCKNCLGRGWFFVDRRETVVIAQHMDSKKRYQDWGEVNKGTASITTRGSDKLGFMDRIILTDLEEWFSEILRPIIFRDALVAYPVYEPLEVKSIYLFISDDEPLYAIPENLYTVSGNKITFDKSLIDKIVVPPMEKPIVTVSIRYSHYPVYHVVDVNRELMKVRERNCSYSNERLTQMPINIVARKAHYIFNAQNFDAEIFENSVK